MADVELPSVDAPPRASGGGAAGVLTKPVGPLPLWGWIAVVGVAGVIVVKRRSGAKAATPDQVTYAQQAQIPTVGNGAGGGSPIVSGGSPKPTTNDGWRSQAVTVLVAKGYSPLAVDTALAKYLQGAALDSTQRALIDIALANLGTPPNPPPASPDGPTTTPNTEPKGETLARWIAAGRAAGQAALKGGNLSVQSAFFTAPDPDPTTTEVYGLSNDEIASAYKQGYTGAANDARSLLNLPAYDYNAGS